MSFHLHGQRLVLCGWERSLRLNCLSCFSSALILYILSRTLFAWFLICFWNHAFMHLHLSIMPLCICIFLLCVCLFLVNCLVFFFFKIEKLEKYKNCVCFVYIGTCVPWMAIETKFSKLCISCNLDEHLYAQLSKWVLWLLFVMSKIKLSIILNTHVTLFYGKN